MINVNRVALEETTGADLIYYDNTYRSHIMIQYKMMTTEELKRENEKDKNGKKKESKETEEAKVYYYSPNKQFRDQVTRMTSFVARVSGSGPAPTELPPAPPLTRQISPTRASWLYVSLAAKLDEKQCQQVEHIRAGHADLETAYQRETKPLSRCWQNAEA